MKHLLGTAFASVAFASMALAAPNGEASWLELDKDIASLSTTVADNGTYINGFIRSYYDNNSDADVGGVRFEMVRINVNGQMEDFKWRASWEMASGTAKLKDAWAKWKLSDSVGITWGQFKRPNTYAFNVSGGKRLMILPTMNVANQKREAGFMLNGSAMDKTANWWFAVQNGSDGVSDDLHMQGRFTYDFMGKGGFLKHEGAVDAPEKMGGSFGIGYCDDQDDVTGGSNLMIDAVVTGNRMYFHLEMFDYDDDFGTVDKTTGNAMADTSPMALTGSYMLGDDMELGLRFEDWDDVDDSTRTTLNFNFYQVLPHRAKWTISYTDMSSDDVALEAEIFSAGLTLNI